MIKFCSIPIIGNELKYINSMPDENNSINIAGNRQYAQKCEKFLESTFHFKRTLLTNSCSSSLEICALLMLKEAQKRNIKNPSIILPSYTFICTANAFAKFGFRLKFVDINPDSMNLDEEAAKAAISSDTLAIVTVNYAGCSADLFKLKDICDQNNIFLIEDAAQSINAKVQDAYQGSIGDLTTISFDEAKNVSCGEGGALIINNDKFFTDAEIIRDKGTNRGKFFRGEISKYSWVDLGGHYLLSDLSAAFLLGQLEKYQDITNKRLALWQQYHDNLSKLEQSGYLTLQRIPEHNQHNGHLFYIKLANAAKRQELINYLKTKGIPAFFHYIPLHDSECGNQSGEFVGEDKYTTKESQRLLRLPLHFGLSETDVSYITDQINLYFPRTTY